MDPASIAIVIAAVSTPAFFVLFGGLAISRGPLWTEGLQAYEYNRRRARESLPSSPSLRDTLFDLYRNHEWLLQFLSAAYGVSLLVDIVAVAVSPSTVSVWGVTPLDALLALSLATLMVALAVTLFALGRMFYGTNAAFRQEDDRRQGEERLERIVNKRLEGMEERIRQRMVEWAQAHPVSGVEQPPKETAKPLKETPEPPGETQEPTKETVEKPREPPSQRGPGTGPGASPPKK